MGKIIIAVFIMATSLLSAENIKWLHKFPLALSQAQESQKPIFFVLTSQKHNLTKEIEKNKAAVKLINKNFIAFVSYADQSDYVPNELVTPMLQSMWFLTPRGQLMYKQGSYTGHVFLEDLLEALPIVSQDMKRAIAYMKNINKPYALNVKFKYYTNLEVAKKAAKKAKKPIFMLVGRNACKYCVKLKNEVLVDKKILKDLEKNFVVLVHDANRPLSRQYSTPGIPAIWFLKDDGMPISRPLVGFVPKNNLINEMSNIKLEFKK